MNVEQVARAHFEALTREQVVEAIRCMAREGYSDHTIACACRLAVEEVRRILGEPPSVAEAQA